MLAVVESQVAFLSPFIERFDGVPSLIVTGFGKIDLNAANNFFQYPRVKPDGSIFFKKKIMAEMDRHQLALAYDAVISSGVL